MQKQLVVTVIGADKPGIVESLADTITRQQGNWLASSMSELAGQFAGILHVAVPDEHYRSLCEALVMLPGLTVSFAEGQLSLQPAHQVMLSVTGNDRPGIVHEVASILRQLNINVADLTTGCEPAPHSGALLCPRPGGPAAAARTGRSRHGPGVLSDDLVVDIDQDLSE
jgi:glycine cleavage system regulatory protein